MIYDTLGPAPFIRTLAAGRDGNWIYPIYVKGIQETNDARTPTSLLNRASVLHR